MAEDDGTGIGFGLRDKTKTSGDRKIQVRMSSGKIYGPYGRVEILEFIASKKLRGEEQILIEGESDWKIITSDTQFFDALQSAYFGKLSHKIPATEVSQPDRDTLIQGQKKAAPKATPAKVSPNLKEIPKATDKKSSSSKQSPKLKGHPSERETATRWGTQAEVPPQASESPHKITGPEAKSAKSSQKNSLVVPLAVVVVAAASAFYYLKPQGPLKIVPKSFGAFSSHLWYTKPLQIALEGIEIKTPAMPAQIVGTEMLGLPESFGAMTWAKELKALSADVDPESKSKASYWARWAWSSLWLGATLEPFDKNLGRNFTETGTALVADLERRKLLSPGYVNLFKSVPLIVQGQWAAAASLLEAQSDIPLAQWLSEECAWQLFWAHGAKESVFHPLVKEYTATALELPAKLRSSFMAHDETAFFDWVKQLAANDPMSPHLWLGVAERSWRLARDQVQIANRSFMTGLGTLSLLPASFQANYWDQFAQFLQTYGRASTAQKAAINRDALAGKGTDASSGLLSGQLSGQWWDLNQEGLDIESLAKEIQTHANTAMLNSSDLATLNVLGYVLPNGAVYLNTAGEHWAFEKNWSRATKIFEQVSKVDSRNAEGLGGLIWSYASQYEFDLAFKVQDQLSTLALSTPEAQKYSGVIQTIGREYAEASKELTEYTKSVPNNAWGFYFLSRLYEAQEKNVDCMKSANLARLHATGELQLRSNLLWYQCRILAKLGVRDALKELSAMVSREQDNVPVRLTYIDALVNADIPDQAILAAREAVGKFPRSYEFRMKLAEVYQRSRDEDRAVVFYQGAAKERPDMAEPWVKIGQIFEHEKRFQEAAQNFETASRMEPGYPEVWLFAARAYANAGKTRDAAQMYAREIDARPAVLETFIEAAEFLLKINAPQEVPVLFRKFKADFQDDPRVLTRLAQAYAAMNELDNAQQAAATALARNPNIAEAYRVLGMVNEKQGQMEESAKNYNRYLELLPQAVDADVIRAKLQSSPFSQ